MPRIDPLITNFSAGELSPLIEGRVDIDSYRSGAQLMRNMITTPHGPAKRRGGTLFIAAVKDSTLPVRLFPFSVGEDRTYMIEAGPLYFRFYTQQGQIISGTPVEIITPYTASDLPLINTTQSANVLYLACPNVAPQKLIRTSDTSWTLSAIAFTSTPTEWVAGNYPSVVAFYEQRLIWAATPNEPQQLWASVSASYEDLTTGTGDSAAYTYTLASTQVNAIQWMNPGETLTIGTKGGVFKMSSGSLNEPITPTNVKITRQVPIGCAAIHAKQVGDSIIFVQLGGRKVRKYTFEFANDSYSAEDLTLLSEHITRSGVKEFALQDEPDTRAWMVLNNGLLIGCTMDVDAGVQGWHLHNAAGTDSEIESIGVVSSEIDVKYDDIYLVVSRTINGVTAKYIEILTPGLKDETSQDSILSPDQTTKDEQQDYAFYVDSGIVYDGVSTTTITGLSHLEGEDVAVLADGAVQPSQTVSSGQITLSTAASVVNVGLNFESKLQTLRLEGEGRNRGTAQGKAKRISKVAVRVHRSLGLQAGTDENGFDDIIYGELIIMGQARPLFSGDVSVDFPGGYDTDGRMTFKQNLPLPMTLVSLMPQMRIQ